MRRFERFYSNAQPAGKSATPQILSAAVDEPNLGDDLARGLLTINFERAPDEDVPNHSNRGLC